MRPATPSFLHHLLRNAPVVRCGRFDRSAGRAPAGYGHGPVRCRITSPAVPRNGPEVKLSGVRCRRASLQARVPSRTRSARAARTPRKSNGIPMRVRVLESAAPVTTRHRHRCGRFCRYPRCSSQLSDLVLITHLRLLHLLRQHNTPASAPVHEAAPIIRSGRSAEYPCACVCMVPPLPPRTTQIWSGALLIYTQTAVPQVSATLV